MLNSRKLMSIFWLAMKIMVIVLLSNSARTVFVYQNF